VLCPGANRYKSTGFSLASGMLQRSRINMILAQGTMVAPHPNPTAPRHPNP
jgi:hypothetical protein